MPTAGLKYGDKVRWESEDGKVVKGLIVGSKTYVKVLVDGKTVERLSTDLKRGWFDTAKIWDKRRKKDDKNKENI